MSLRNNFVPVMLFAFVFSFGCYDSAGPSSDDGDDNEEDCEFIIAVDFPCRFNSLCESETKVLHCRTVSCEEETGTTCCIGATCRVRESEDCPEGTICLEKIDAEYGFGVGNAACLPPPTADASTDVDYDVWLEPEAYSTYCR